MEEKELRNIIVKHTSIMLDNPDKYGIYPTGKFYNNLEKEIITFIEQQLQAYKDRENKLIKWCYEHGQEINATDILDIIDFKILNKEER